MKMPKLKTRGLACGAVTTAVVTLLVAGDFLPAGWQSPEAVAALTGLIASLAAAFGACDPQHTYRARDDDDREGA